MALTLPWHLDPRTHYDEWREWWANETNPPDRFLLGEFGAEGGVHVELVLAAKSFERKTFVERERTPEEVIGTFAPKITIKKLPKRVATKTVEVVASHDHLALQEKPQDVTEFSLTNPTEKDLKKMKRRR